MIYDKALNPDIWPHRVGVRIFRNKRNFLNPTSWSAQSSQTGGHVMASNSNVQRTQPMNRLNDVFTTAQSSDLVEVQNRFVVPGFLTEVVN